MLLFEKDGYELHRSQLSSGLKIEPDKQTEWTEWTFGPNSIKCNLCGRRAEWTG